MRLRIVWIFMGLILAFGQQDARAVELSILGGTNMNLPYFSATTSNSATFNSFGTSPVFAPDVGILGKFPFPTAPAFSVETGLFYLSRISILNESGTLISGSVPFTGTLQENINYLSIPVIFAYQATSSFSFGLGGYYARGIGMVLDTNDVSMSGGTIYTHPDSSEGWEYSRYNRDDYGVAAKVGYRYPLGSGFGFRLDAMAFFSLNNLDQPPITGSGNSTITELHRDIQVLAGLTYSFDSARPVRRIAPKRVLRYPPRARISR